MKLNINNNFNPAGLVVTKGRAKFSIIPVSSSNDVRKGMVEIAHISRKDWSEKDRILRVDSLEDALEIISNGRFEQELAAWKRFVNNVFADLEKK